MDPTPNSDDDTGRPQGPSRPHGGPGRASPALGGSEDREHDLTMHVFAVSSGLVGVCLTAIGLLRLVTAQTQVQTLGDDLLAVNAIVFVLCAFLAFWSFKTRVARRRQRLRVLVDVLFLAGLAIMAVSCAVITYAIF